MRRAPRARLCRHAARAARRVGESAAGASSPREPFGNLEKVADGVGRSFRRRSAATDTVSNGGIIAGTNAVLAIEGFNQPQGAQWLAGKGAELTGRGRRTSR